MGDDEDTYEVLTRFVEKYGLRSDPVLTADQLLQYNQPLANVRTGEPPSLQEWQSWVCDILLIPQVPKAVKHTFATAKKLFIFGYCEYSFSTASQHYALLALEAALQSRWVATLPDPCPVTYRNGVTNNLHDVSHQLLLDHSRGSPNLMVNGGRFPRSYRKLAAALEKLGIITSQDGRRILAGLDVRNTLSHREFATIMGASADLLASVAELINTMFDSVPLASAPS